MTVDDVRSVLAEYLPSRDAPSVRWLGEGWDNVVYEVDGDLIVRFVKEDDDPGAVVTREAGLLDVVVEVLSVPVPRPVFVVPERGCMAYPKLPGISLLDLPDRVTRGEALAPALGELHAALHAISPAPALAEVDDWSPISRLKNAAKDFSTTSAHVPARYHAMITAFLRTAGTPPATVPSFCHNDLGMEHVLVDPRGSAITGIIDWTDAAIADPAYDFGRLLCDLGPIALDRALAAYGPDTADLRARAVFSARCTVFDDLAYGLDLHRPHYVAKCVEALEWLFPA